MNAPLGHPFVRLPARARRPAQFVFAAATLAIALQLSSLDRGLRTPAAPRGMISFELAATAEQGARELFRSLQRLKALPDHVEVLPGAFSGSVCGRRLSGKPSSTIGSERRYNQAFRIEDQDEFVRFMLEDIPAPPPRAAELRGINAGLAAA